MSREIMELAGLEVQVEDVIYMPSLDAPSERPHPFVYFIAIQNNSGQAVTIRARKWVISQENGEKIVVEGDGVVSQYPLLEDGESFRYNSYHVISENSRATGAFFGETEDGRLVFARVPTFEMNLPQWV
ncbi:MAG: ApaG domain [Verrucomicrobiales bacterium]